MNFLPPTPSATATTSKSTSTPAFVEQAEFIASKVVGLSAPDFAAALGNPNAKITGAAKDAFSRFGSEDTIKLPALHAFDGFAYKKLNGRALDSSGFEYCHQSLRILDPIYGVLKGGDLMQEYRMELENKVLLVGEERLTLKAYWKTLVTDNLIEDFGSAGEAVGILLDVASKEYSDLVDKAKLSESGIQSYEIKFEGLNGKSPPSVTLKYLRGDFVRACALNGVDDLEGVKGLTFEGYSFDAIQEGKKGKNSITFKAGSDGGGEEEKPAKKRAKKN